MAHMRMTPDDFVKLKEFARFSQCSLKDAITELASATLSQYALTDVLAAGEQEKLPPELLTSEDLSYEQLCDFLRFYLNADVGDDMAERLFGSLKRTVNRRRSKAKIKLRKVSAVVSATGIAISDMSVVLRQKAAEAFSSPVWAGKRPLKSKLEKRESSRTALMAAAMGASAAIPAVRVSKSDEAMTPSSEERHTCASNESSTPPNSAGANATSKVSLQDVVCFLCLLETGSPTDKLGLLFRMYDLDHSGYLESEEIRCILDQMMTVSQCLGWDTTELQPMLEELIQELDVDEDGRISKIEWMESGKRAIPLLVLLGVDTTLQEGGHKWRLKRFKTSVHCNMCRGRLLGYKQGFICNLCFLTVHERCLLRVRQSCIRTYVKSRRAQEVMTHHWVEGHCSGKCSECGRKIKSGNILCGLRCRWCQRVLHNGCEAVVPQECDLGQHKHCIVSPVCIRPSKGQAKEEEAFGELTSACAQLEPVPEAEASVFEDEESVEEASATVGSLALSKHSNIMSAEGFRLQILGLPENVQPLVAFINPKSGGRQGIRVFRKLQCILNPRQVFDLTKGGPNPGLIFIASLPNSRVMCCGGDGTVGWILSALDELGWERRPPVGVIPLGTGNDLARCLKWGGGYEGGSLDKILQQMADAEIVQLDRWRIKVNSIPVAEEEEGKAEEGDKVPYDVMNNYFSVGVDASIAHKFHVMREKHPEKFQSRVRNKFRYFEIASHENFASSCKDLADNLEVECDGRLLMLGRRSLEGIAVLNIPSIYGGTNLWGSEHDSRASSRDCRSTSVSTDPEYFPQAMDDKMLEVVGVQGALHMGQIKMGFKQSGNRLAQCSTLTIRTNCMLPMQIDGEPWMQQPCEISISHLNQMPMLGQRPKPTNPSGSTMSRLRCLFRRREQRTT